MEFGGLQVEEFGSLEDLRTWLGPPLGDQRAEDRRGRMLILLDLGMPSRSVQNPKCSEPKPSCPDYDACVRTRELLPRDVCPCHQSRWEHTRRLLDEYRDLRFIVYTARADLRPALGEFGVSALDYVLKDGEEKQALDRTRAALRQRLHTRLRPLAP